MGTEQLKQNIEAGKLAKDMFEFIISESKTLKDIDQRKRFFDKMNRLMLKALSDGQKSEVVCTKPMSDQESKSFGNEIMKFGSYEGTRIDNVPLDYLAWLHDASKLFVHQVGRYLISQRIIVENNRSG